MAAQTTYNLVGVVEDGSPRASNVPANPRTPLNLTIGADVLVKVSVVTAGGARVSMLGGATLVFTIRKKASDGSNVLKITRTDPGDEATFSIPAAAFKNHSAGIYCYDVWYTVGGAGGARSPVIPLSPLHLEGTATEVP